MSKFFNSGAAKAVAALLVGLVGQGITQLLALGVLTGSARNVVELIGALLTAAAGHQAVYWTKNLTPQPSIGTTTGG